MFDITRRPSTTLGLSTLEEMDKIFDNFWRSAGIPTGSVSLPSLDIYSQDDKHMIVEMQAPGFEEGDIDISVRDGLLEIRGERHETDEPKEAKRSYWVRESNASFARRIALPEGADADNISAELDKGLLKITVPVIRPEAKRIAISNRSRDGAKKLTAKLSK